MADADMSLNALLTEIVALRQRIVTLEASQADRRTLIDELQSTLEALRIAGEELRLQNEELGHAKQQTEAAHQRYQDLFNWAPDGYLVTDTHGTIAEANQYAGSLLAVSPHRLEGKPLATFVVLGRRQDFRKQLAYLPQAQHGQEWETTLQPQHGPPFPAAITATAIHTAGRISGFRWLLRDITERKHIEQTLRKSQHQLRRLAGHLQQIQEQERARIAREIHDEVAQSLTALHLDLAWLVTRLPNVPEVYDRLQAMVAQLEALDTTARHIATELRPPLLDDLGLLAAIEWQLQDVSQRTGLAYALLMPHEEITLDPEQATAVFRIFQEALTNVVRHADASEVVVRVHAGPDAIRLEVADDGQGITPEQLDDPAALGLLGMRERAMLWDGEVSVQGKPGVGTTVTLRMPFTSEAEDVA
jgi:PAS domain S-box-containing protein